MSTAQYHKSATRDVRPFFGAASLEEALNGAQIRLFEDQPFADGTTFTIEEQDIAKLNVTIRPNLSEALLKSGAIARGDLALAITAFNPFIKKTIVVGKFFLSMPAPDEITIGAETLEKLGNGSTMTIEAALCLTQELPKTPGSPFLQGHWLSKKAFDLRPPKLAEDFDIDPMEDENWKAMGFPPKTLYFVEYFTGINEPVSKERQMAKVRIHADVFKRLALNSNQKMAKSVMGLLAAEIPAQILASSYTDWKDADEVEKGSPLAAFLKRLNRVHPCALADLKQMVAVPGMPKLRAILQADQQSVRQIVEA